MKKVDATALGSRSQRRADSYASKPASRCISVANADAETCRLAPLKIGTSL